FFFFSPPEKSWHHPFFLHVGGPRKQSRANGKAASGRWHLRHNPIVDAGGWGARFVQPLLGARAASAPPGAHSSWVRSVLLASAWAPCSPPGGRERLNCREQPCAAIVFGAVQHRCPKITAQKIARDQGAGWWWANIRDKWLVIKRRSQCAVQVQDHVCSSGWQAVVDGGDERGWHGREVDIGSWWMRLALSVQGPIHHLFVHVRCSMYGVRTTPYTAPTKLHRGDGQRAMKGRDVGCGFFWARCYWWPDWIWRWRGVSVCMCGCVCFCMAL
ncbi:hypothetical protein MAPG_07005, partial [Magnaporthiopsis poae ATCC 64411]